VLLPGRVARYKPQKIYPQELLEIITEEDKEKREQLRKAVSTRTYTNIFAPYFAKFVGFWAGIDEEELLGQGYFEGGPVMTWKQLEKLWAYLEARLAKFPHEENFKSFKVGKKEFFLPAKFMKGSTVIEFAEISEFEAQLEDLEEKGNWGAMSKIMAVICRPAGEFYDYKKVEPRAKMFEKLTMDIVLNVAFFLSKLNKKFAQASQIYILSFHLAKRKRELKRFKTNLAGT